MLARIRTVLGMIKFSHSVFALPFALCGAWFAADGIPPLGKLLLIICAAVTARSAAMGFNRLADLRFDRDNPRTRMRALPAGQLRPGFVLGFVLLNGALFLLLAWLINPLCFYLSPLVLGILLLYSLTKRWTAFSHGVLGLCLGLAPMGAWLAIQGSFAGDLRIPLILGGVVLLWVAGFDLIYACQDVEYDRKAGLHSFPARFGIPAALGLSTILHLGMVGLLAWLGILAGLALAYWIGLGLVGVLLFFQHLVVRPDDLSRVNLAFFTLNGWIGVGFFGATALDFWLRGGGQG